MDEDEIDGWVECKEPGAVPPSKINRADMLAVLIHPVSGLLMGAVNGLGVLQGLLSLHSAAIDEKKQKKAFQKDAKRDLESIING